MTPKQASIKAPAEHREERLRSVEAYARSDRNAQEAALTGALGERVISVPLLMRWTAPNGIKRAKMVVVESAIWKGGRP